LKLVEFFFPSVQIRFDRFGLLATGRFQTLRLREIAEESKISATIAP